MAFGLPLALAVACDNHVTEVPPVRAPSAAPLAAKAPFKSVFELNPIIGTGQFSLAISISDLGQAVGASGAYATIWDNSDIGQSLGLLPGGTSSSASAISRDGTEIVGYANDGSSNNHPVRWLKSNGAWIADRLTEYFTGPCFPDAVSSDGTAIVGNCNGTAVVWLNGRLIVLGTGTVYGVNKNGQAVGTTSTSDHALVWKFTVSPVAISDLGTLGGSSALAYAINDAGQITGWSETTNHESHAFLWSPRKGVMVDIGLPGANTGCYSINETGQAVGFAYTNGSLPRGAFFDGGKVVDLGVLPGYDQALTTSINNNGQAVGYSYTQSFSQFRGTEWLLK